MFLLQLSVVSFVSLGIVFSIFLLTCRNFGIPFFGESNPVILLICVSVLISFTCVSFAVTWTSSAHLLPLVNKLFICHSGPDFHCVHAASQVVWIWIVRGRFFFSSCYSHYFKIMIYSSLQCVEFRALLWPHVKDKHMTSEAAMGWSENGNLSQAESRCSLDWVVISKMCSGSDFKANVKVAPIWLETIRFFLHVFCCSHYCEKSQFVQCSSS